jgi:nucleotide-binding universal stress UspA family protein
MFKKILFPTDFSEEAKTELGCITSIPGIREIILLHVIKQSVVPMGAPMAEDLAVHTAEVYLRKAKIYIAELNPNIQVILQETISTDITGAILEKAEKEKVDLIVIHATIRSMMMGVLLNCVSSKVLCRISNINILIMPNKLVSTLEGKAFEKFCPMIFSRILCPVNFSAFSKKTTVLACSLRGVGEIILLHVIKKDKSGSNHGEAITAAEQQIKTICEPIVAQGIKARSIVVTGKPEHEIARIASEEDVSLIWMRVTGKGCLHDFFFGSLVHDVVMKSTRPVIIIRSYPE